MKPVGLEPIIWSDEGFFLLDQRILPNQEVLVKITNIEDCYAGIKDMVVRGAPCIGFTAILGLGQWLNQNPDKSFADFEKICDYLKQARPTAVNLAYEVDRCLLMVREKVQSGKLGDIGAAIIRFGQQEIVAAGEKNLQMAKFAADDLAEKYGDKKLKLQTHCNTGILACGTLGTALGVISHLNSIGRVESVWVDETRPYLQGSRLSSYELLKENIDHKIVVEGAASHLMSKGLVDAIFVGADRIALNGDTANKVGTSNLAVLAHHYNVPFYVVAPLSSFDSSAPSGEHIEIELRDEDEILKYKDHYIAHKDASAYNPSFDITDGKLITGIICEKKLMKGYYQNQIKELFN